MKLAPVVLLLAFLGCQSGGGTSVAAEGVTLRLNLFTPGELAEGAEGTIDILVSNRGVGPAGAVLADVELPPQLTVAHESHGMGVSLIRDTRLYRYTINGLGVGQDSRIRYTVRASFGGAAETGPIHVTAYQPQVGGDRLERTATIRMAK